MPVSAAWDVNIRFMINWKQGATFHTTTVAMDMDARPVASKGL
jgi:hypothetical protein